MRAKTPMVIPKKDRKPSGPRPTFLRRRFLCTIDVRGFLEKLNLVFILNLHWPAPTPQALWARMLRKVRAPSQVLICDARDELGVVSLSWGRCKHRHDRSRLFELARLLVRFDHIASFIINVNHCVVRTAQKLGVVDCTADCVWLAIPQPTKRQCVTD